MVENLAAHDPSAIWRTGADDRRRGPSPLSLILFTEDHFATVASWFTNERQIVQWAGPAVHHPIDVAQLQAMVDESHTRPPARLCYMASRDGELVGHAQLAFDWRNGNARLGRVAISPVRRGQGLAAPMLRLVLTQAFSRAEIERVELGVYTWNVAAIRTYRRLGFTLEGVRLGFSFEGVCGSSVLVGDERWDIAEMAVLRTEWLRTADPSVQADDHEYRWRLRPALDASKALCGSLMHLETVL
jgi:RimJ/RimL family protein N-acetyltransferase